LRAADAVGVEAVGDREGLAGLEGGDAGELPAAEQVPDEAALVAEERALDDVAEDRPVRAVVLRQAAVQPTPVTKTSSALLMSFEKV
jgi:hypothetical protein